MIILFLISCFTAKSQQPHVHAQVEVVDSEIEIIFVEE